MVTIFALIHLRCRLPFPGLRWQRFAPRCIGLELEVALVQAHGVEQGGVGCHRVRELAEMR